MPDTPQTLAEWVVFAVTTAKEIVTSWPSVVALLAVVFRASLMSAARWFGSQASHRGFQAAGPGGLSLLMESPTTEAIIHADESAAEALAAGGAGEANPEIASLVTRLDGISKAFAEVQAAWTSEALDTDEARARRLAERARTYMESGDEFLDAGGTIAFYDSGSRLNPPRELVRFAGTRAAKALLLVTFFKPWVQGLEEASYVDYVRAAQILNDSGHSSPIPPFDPQVFELAKRATSVGHPFIPEA